MTTLCPTRTRLVTPPAPPDREARVLACIGLGCVVFLGMVAGWVAHAVWLSI